MFGGGTRDQDGNIIKFNRVIQRLDVNHGWRILDKNISLDIEHQLPVIPLEFYWTNNWPQIDVLNMPPPGEPITCGLKI